MRNIKTYTQYLNESANVDLETNRVNQAKIKDLVKQANAKMAAIDANKGLKDTVKQAQKAALTAQIATHNTALAKLQTTEATLMATVAKEQAKM